MAEPTALPTPSPSVTAAPSDGPGWVMPWPSWIPMPTADAETITVSVPTTVTGSGFSTVFTTEATVTSIEQASAAATSSSSSGDISDLAGLLGLPGFGDDGSRRASVALVCLSFALGVAGLILLFLAARWYRIRQQKKRNQSGGNADSQQNQQPSQSEQFPDNDVERQLPTAGSTQGGGMARSHSAQSNVSRFAAGEVQEGGRDSPVSPETYSPPPPLPTHHALWSRDV